MEVSILNVRDSIERILYLKTQLRVTEEFAPFPFIGEDTDTLTIHKEENFMKVVEAYGLDEGDIHVEEKPSCTKKWINIRGISVEVFIHKEDENNDNE